ncbi:hypothetical protein ARMGADRAFT_1069328 [Armillaria gallica]|uniref:Uncharacterized protein n=1 Tax=Armillaria gallica TaxID=47427 RepID=A0A2H3CEF9_ARMGA|nr:hypothetical protein ARMGADRAFT_1069328 [Armillaria gallica]
MYEALQLGMLYPEKQGKLYLVEDSTSNKKSLRYKLQRSSTWPTSAAFYSPLVVQLVAAVTHCGKDHRVLVDHRPLFKPSSRAPRRCAVNLGEPEDNIYRHAQHSLDLQWPCNGACIQGLDVGKQRKGVRQTLSAHSLLLGALLFFRFHDVLCAALQRRGHPYQASQSASSYVRFRVNIHIQAESSIGSLYDMLAAVYGIRSPKALPLPPA